MGSTDAGRGQPSHDERSGGGHVLVVEDNDEIANTLIELFDDEQIDARRACNGREALDILDQGMKPCVVLLDLMMPVMDGWTFLRTVRGLEPYQDLPILVVSAAVDAQALRYTKYSMTKPPEIGELLRLVQGLCEKEGHAC